MFSKVLIFLACTTLVFSKLEIEGFKFDFDCNTEKSNVGGVFQVDNEHYPFVDVCDHDKIDVAGEILKSIEATAGSLANSIE